MLEEFSQLNGSPLIWSANCRSTATTRHFPSGSSGWPRSGSATVCGTPSRITGAPTWVIVEPASSARTRVGVAVTTGRFGPGLVPAFCSPVRVIARGPEPTSRGTPALAGARPASTWDQVVASGGRLTSSGSARRPSTASSFTPSVRLPSTTGRSATGLTTPPLSSASSARVPGPPVRETTSSVPTSAAAWSSCAVAHVARNVVPRVPTAVASTTRKTPWVAPPRARCQPASGRTSPRPRPAAASASRATSGRTRENSAAAASAQTTGPPARNGSKAPGVGRWERSCRYARTATAASIRSAPERISRPVPLCRPLRGRGGSALITTTTAGNTAPASTASAKVHRSAVPAASGHHELGPGTVRR